MYFLVNHDYKVIFGWSAKCGCSHIKNIFWYLKNNKINNRIHTNEDRMQLPNDIENYTTIIFCRNPYTRVISGFLDKYNVNGQYRHLWKYDNISFYQFIGELIKFNWKLIEKHHFIPQTDEYFDINKIIKSKYIKFYDIENIDYEYIENLFNKQIPTKILNVTFGHERKKYDEYFEEFVYYLDINTYYHYNVSIKYFYNEELQQKVYNFYENDFKIFKQYGFDYKII